MAKREPTMLIDEHGVEYEYTEEMANRDHRALDAALRPLNDAFLARVGKRREDYLLVSTSPPRSTERPPPRHEAGACVAGRKGGGPLLARPLVRCGGVLRPRWGLGRRRPP